MPTQPPPITPKFTSAGYPLSALFVLVTVVAILAAALSPLAQTGVDRWWLFAGVAICTISGVVLGAMIGACYRPWWLCAMYGAGGGAVLGFMVGPLVQISVESLPVIFAASGGGAVAMVAMAVIFRLAERKRELPPLADHAISLPSSPAADEPSN